jgi:hypothetical protein
LTNSWTNMTNSDSCHPYIEILKPLSTHHRKAKNTYSQAMAPFSKNWSHRTSWNFLSATNLCIWSWLPADGRGAEGRLWDLMAKMGVTEWLIAPNRQKREILQNRDLIY